jgi:transcriptional regulator with XRE-family HTH domain
MTGDQFRRHRKRLGFTQAGLAHRIGVHPITLSRWERGRIDVPEPVVQLMRLLPPARSRTKMRPR